MTSTICIASWVAVERRDFQAEAAAKTAEEVGIDMGECCNVQQQPIVMGDVKREKQ